jgi:soluble lytic murein transglycosylase-like protein
MNQRAILGLALGGGLLAWLLYSQRQSFSTLAQTGVEDVQSAVSGWQSVNQGPLWVPALHGAESQWGIPTDLLARMAYQESRFRQEFIDGTKASAAGALGILQLMPAYFASVQVPRPFTSQDTGAQIQQAAQELTRLYGVFRDWGLALASYNDGQGNVQQYLAGSRPLPDETLNYVSEVLADVPITGATIPT